MTQFRALTRLAVRDTRSHWLRAVIVIALVAIATFLINAQSLVHLGDEPGERSAYQRVAGAQASVDFNIDQNIIQDVYGRDFDRASSQWDTAEDSPWTLETVGERAKSLEALAGENTIVPVVATEYIAASDVSNLAFPMFTAVQGPWDLIARQVEIAEGRSPQSPGEMAISSVDAASLDLQLGDHVEIKRAGPFGQSTESPATVTVVGVIENQGIFLSEGTFPQLDHVLSAIVSGETASLTDEDAQIAVEVPEITTFKLVGEKEIDWEAVRAANRDGLVVTSRAVLDNPPQQSQIEPSYVEYAKDPMWVLAASLLGSLAVFAIALFIPLSILFAQSSMRTSRIVRIVGATNRQWFAVLALTQAILVGIGVIAGHLLGILVVGAYLYRTYGEIYNVPFDWRALVAQLPMAIAISFVSAKIGYDQVENSHGTHALTSTPPSRKNLFIGIGLVVGGSVFTAGSWLTDSSLAMLLPLFLTAVAVGVVLLVPTLLHGLDRAMTHRATYSRERRRATWRQAVSLAARDLRRRRHRTVPAVAAITLTISGMLIIGILLGVGVSSSGADNTAFDDQHGLIIPRPITLDSGVARERFTRAIEAMNESTSVTGEAELSGNFLGVMTRENADLMLDLDMYDSQLDRLISTRPRDMYAQYMEGADDAMVFHVGARSPDGTYHGCPGVNPHEYRPQHSGHPSTEQESASCRFIEATAVGKNQISFPETVSFFVDDGSFVSQAGAGEVGNGDEAADILRRGGVLVNDPGLIVDGQTTVVLSSTRVSSSDDQVVDPAFDNSYVTLPDMPLDEGIPNRIEVRAVTVPAVAYPVPLDRGDAVILSPPVASQLGLKAAPIAQLVKFNTSPAWWSIYHAADDARQAVPQIVVESHQSDIEMVRDNLWFFAVLTGMVMFITVMLAILAALEVRRPMDIFETIGANGGFKHWFGAAYTAITVMLGIIGALIVLLFVTGIVLITRYIGEVFFYERYFLDIPLMWLRPAQILALALLPFLAAIVGAVIIPSRGGHAPKH
ncbi:MAG: hypothetical protein Q4P05_08655 [Actinomycetaceae bacterium]|nr:hypothetical protein [Actinomycetaceae bacterium]